MTHDQESHGTEKREIARESEREKESARRNKEASKSETSEERERERERVKKKRGRRESKKDAADRHSYWVKERSIDERNPRERKVRQ